MLNGSSSRRLQEKSSLNFAELELDISNKNLEIHMLRATKAENLTKTFLQNYEEALCKISEVLSWGIFPPN